jgi:hypothetical protein
MRPLRHAVPDRADRAVLAASCPGARGSDYEGEEEEARLSAHRKLTPEAEAAIIAWYSQYQKLLNELRRLGSINQKAVEYGIATRSIHTIVKREQEKARRVGNVSPEEIEQCRHSIVVRRERRTTALALRGQGKTYREIAEALGITTGRAYTLVRAARLARGI